MDRTSLQSTLKSPCIITPLLFHVDKQSKKTNKTKCDAQNETHTRRTVNFFNPLPFIFPSHTTHIHSPFVPALPLLSFFFSNPLLRLLLPRCLSLFNLFPLSHCLWPRSSIKANLTRQRKVTCTQGEGHGEVEFKPWGAAYVPEDCGQCDKDEAGGAPTWP